MIPKHYIDNPILSLLILALPNVWVVLAWGSLNLTSFRRSINL